MLRIKYTKDSIQDLNNIKDYIYGENSAAAKRVITHIILSISNLKVTPNIGRMSKVLRTRELVITKYPYIVPYSVADGTINILRILHTSKKWENQDSL